MVDHWAWREAGGVSPKSESRRARDTWRHIRRDPDTILLARGDDDIPAQTVHIALNAGTSAGSAVGDAGGMSSSTDATIVGVVNHPSVPDTDVQKGDSFLLDGLRYEVKQVLTYPGRIEAKCEAMS